MDTTTILKHLKIAKERYKPEGFIIKALFGSYSRGEQTPQSDVDVLVEATPKFANKYGFNSIKRINEIQKELSKTIGLKVDLADSSGMGQTAQKFIINRAIYV